MSYKNGVRIDDKSKEEQDLVYKTALEFGWDGKERIGMHFLELEDIPLNPLEMELWSYHRKKLVAAAMRYSIQRDIICHEWKEMNGAIEDGVDPKEAIEAFNETVCEIYEY